MRCDVCQKTEATVFLTQIVEGKMQKVNLCEACAKDKGVGESGSFAMADLLLGLGATQQIERGQPSQHCPVCGFTQADFKKTGRLGCSACYARSPTGWPTFSAACTRASSTPAKCQHTCRAASPWPTE